MRAPRLARWGPGPWTRLREGAWPAAHAAAAAGLAWFLASDVIGHGQPFFAPIAAAVSLSASRGQRGTRAVQMMLGVVVGILVADAAVALLGRSAAVIALTTFVAMVVALTMTSGLMFANQAAASAILVIALHQHGTAANRLIDALIGGGCALLFSQVLFPVDPVGVLRDAVRDVVTSCADALAGCLKAMEGEEPIDLERTLALTHQVHEALARFAAAQRTSQRVTWMSRHRPARARVEAARARVLRLDLLANGVLSLVRSVAREVATSEAPSPRWLRGAVGDLCAALRANAEGPTERDRVRELASRARRAPEPHLGEHDPAVAMLAVHIVDVADDLLAVLGGLRSEQARERPLARVARRRSGRSRPPARARLRRTPP